MLKIFTKHKDWLNIAIIFFTTLIIFGILARHQTVADGDAFYHAKISQIYGQGEWIYSLDFLPLSVLGEKYTDHHFLYHVLIAPFTWFLEPLVATKLVNVILAMGVFLTWYWLAKNLKIKNALLWTLLNLTSVFFVFRLSLIKGVPLALILYFIFLLTLSRYRYFSVGLLTFISVWTYGGWPLFPLTAFVFLIANLITKKKFVESIKVVIASIAGSVAGLIINPFFPQNLAFYKAQIIDIALNPVSLTLQGQEWSPMLVNNLLLSLLPFWVIGLVVATIFVIFKLENKTFLKIDRLSFGLTLLGLSILLIIATLLSSRYIEFLSPLFALSVAWWFTQVTQLETFKRIASVIVESFNVYRMWYAVLFAVFLLSYILQLVNIDSKLQKQVSFNLYAKSSEWLASNYNEETLVFNFDWSYSPAFFYHDSRASFSFGLDPKLTKNQEHLEKLEDLYLQNDEDPNFTIKNFFGADLVLASIANASQVEYLSKYEFTEVYRDSEVVIFR